MYLALSLANLLCAIPSDNPLRGINFLAACFMGGMAAAEFVSERLNRSDAP